MCDDQGGLYRLLGVPKDATQEQIKRAYHQALLRHHPDKTRSAEQSQGSPASIDELLHAFRVLSNGSLREAYDQAVQSGRAHPHTQPGTGPRPAHVVSLDDFLETSTEKNTQWTYQCRCGGVFMLTEDLLEKDIHLVNCDACSETLWAGYEALDDNAA
jgi:diphthamide biosynthesis protein 4